MENRSHADAAAELAELKNLEMAGFVEAAKDPLWVWPVIGLFAGLFLASFEINSTLVSVMASIGYVLGIGVLVALVVRRRGVQPRMNNMPAPLKRIFAIYTLGVFVVVGTILGIGFGVSFVYAGIVAFLLITAGGIWYHQHWRSAVTAMVTS
ncbi:MAG: hypothetical protein ACRBK7_02820 [Acidimicrobiales bacterium]